MSYILDALKKADNERERELSAVPGLNAQADGGSERSSSAMPWRIVALCAFVVLAALIAWLVMGRGEKEVPVAMAPTPAEPAPMAAPAPVPAPMPAPAAPPPVATPTTPLTTAIAPPQARTPPPPPTPRPSPAAAPRPAQAAPPAIATAPKPAAAPGAEARIPSRNELPADIRAALPPLNISGAVYSTTPSARMLFANGLVLREGDAVTADLKVERIGPSASVLSFRGQSFQVKH